MKAISVTYWKNHIIKLNIYSSVPYSTITTFILSRLPTLFLGQNHDCRINPSWDRVVYEEKIKLGYCNTVWIFSSDSKSKNSPSQARWNLTTVITFFTGEILLPQQFQRVKLLPRGVLLVITSKVILFVYKTELVKSLQMPVNVSNLKTFPFFTPKVIPEFVG